VAVLKSPKKAKKLPPLAGQARLRKNGLVNQIAGGEIAIVGDPETADTHALMSVVRAGHQPFQVAALGSPGAKPSAVPLLRNRGLVDGEAAVYVCRAFACEVPVTEPERLRRQLE
jgi:uncharacterized protein YyaL (SSP411 family)